MNSADTPTRVINVPHRLDAGSVPALLKQLEPGRDPTAFLVLRGEDGRFCEGLDLGWSLQADPATLAMAFDGFTRVLQAITAFDGITIALVNGPVLGGGMGLVCACDHIIASECSRFALPEGQLGLVPGLVLPYLMKRLRPADIRRMVYTARPWSAQEALASGLADVVAPADGMIAVMQRSLQEMRRCRPGVARQLRVLMALDGCPDEERSRRGAAVLSDMLARPDTRERLQAIDAFLRAEDSLA